MNSRWLKRWRGRQSYRWADRWPGYAAIGLVVAGAAWGLSKPALADNFARVYYDANTGELVVTMRYRGTNPDHSFSLKWGTCPDADPGTLPEVAVEVLDDQWRDQAQREFKKTVRFSLADMPCRPAKVTLRTAPRFTYTVVIGPQP